jgi:hypothetical protein
MSLALLRALVRTCPDLTVGDLERLRPLLSRLVRGGAA